MHGLRWLGPLASACRLASVEFRRGFLHALDLWPLPPGSRWSQAPGDPIWATVERVNNSSVEVVDHPIMRSLRVLGCSPECAQALLAGRPRPTIEALTVSWSTRSDDWAPELLDPGAAQALLGGERKALPELRRLGIRASIAAQPSAWRWLWTGPLAALEAVRVRVDGEPKLEAWIAQLRADRARVDLCIDQVQLNYALDAKSGFTTMRVTHNVPRWREFERDAMFELLVAALAGAIRGGGVRCVVLEPAVAERERLAAALRSRSLSLAGVELRAGAAR